MLQSSHSAVLYYVKCEILEGADVATLQYNRCKSHAVATPRSPQASNDFNAKCLPMDLSAAERGEYPQVRKPLGYKCGVKRTPDEAVCCSKSPHCSFQALLKRCERKA